MKLTKKSLRKIIKEELDNAVNEQESGLDLSKQDAKKALEVAKMTKDMPEMQAFFDKLEKDPKFMKAIEQMQQEVSSMNEYRRPAGGDPMHGRVPTDDGPTAGMTMIGTMVGSVAGWKVLYTSAGASALATLAPHYGDGLATVGVIGAAVMAPILLGFIIDRIGDKATGRDWNPVIATSTDWRTGEVRRPKRR